MPNGIQDRNYKPKVEKEEIYEESELEKLPGLSSKVIKTKKKNIDPAGKPVRQIFKRNPYSLLGHR